MTFTVTPASPHRKKIQRGPGGNRRNSSQSEPSSEADSAVDSPLSEPLNVDVSHVLMSSTISDNNRSSAMWCSYCLFRICSLVWVPPAKIQVLCDAECQAVYSDCLALKMGHYDFLKYQELHIQ
jgi:hypothetical protein